jgi:hypothetical protein
LFNKSNISRADIHCVIRNGAEGDARPTQPVTLHIAVNITPPNMYNSAPSIPIEDVSSPAKEAIIPGHIQSPTPEEILPPSHHQPFEPGNNRPQEVSTTSAKNPRLALKRADQAVKRMDLSNTWKGAVGKIKWVLDTLGPIAEVRVISFDVLSRTEFHTQHFPPAKMAHSLLLAIPKARPFVSFSERDAHAIFVWMADASRTVST